MLNARITLYSIIIMQAVDSFCHDMQMNVKVAIGNFIMGHARLSDNRLISLFMYLKGGRCHLDDLKNHKKKYLSLEILKINKLILNLLNRINN